VGIGIYTVKNDVAHLLEYEVSVVVVVVVVVVAFISS
jgi:hypothetical protein